MDPDLETLNRETLWRPHPGPQTVFLAAGEFEALYGGAAGGGKSDALLYGGLRSSEHQRGASPKWESAHHG